MSVSEELLKGLEVVVEEFVCLDRNNLQQMAALSEQLEGMVAEGQSNQPVVLDCLNLCANAINAVIMDEVEREEDVIESIGAVLSAVQESAQIEDGDTAGISAAGASLWQGLGRPDGECPFGPASLRNGRAGDLTDRALELLSTAEQAVLQSESGSLEEWIGEARRSLHTLKGDAGLLGQTLMAELAHAAEDLVDSIQERPESIKQRVSILLQLIDAARNVLDDPEAFEDMGKEALTEARTALADSGDVPEQAPAEGAGEPDEEEPPPLSTENIDTDMLFEFFGETDEYCTALDTALLDLESNPTDANCIAAVFRPFHTVKGVAGFLNLVAIGELTHVAESLLVSARDGKLELGPAHVDALLKANDLLRELVAQFSAEAQQGAISQGVPAEVRESMAQLKALSNTDAAEAGNAEAQAIAAVDAGKRVGEILVEAGKTSEQDVAEAVAAQDSGKTSKRVGQLLVDKGVAKAKDVAKAIRAGKPAADRRSGATGVAQVVRVDASKLDDLVAMVGELVIAQTQVTGNETIQANCDEGVRKTIKLQSKIIRDIQDRAMSLRMVPIRPLFQKMARLVRDLAHRAGKEVTFKMSGEDTELDKGFIDSMSDPMVHLVRNAVDHGLEPPEEREAAGKSRAGTVLLSARHESGSVLVEIQDDGRGLNTEKIRAKALKLGLIAADQTMDAQSLHKLIFHSGFSTAAKVTDVSGRGVGMDVVRKTIEALRGRIEIQSNEGTGSTFTLRLPLTMAIIDGMITRIGNCQYVFPTLSLERTFRSTPDQIVTYHGSGEALHDRGEILPIVRLHRMHNIPGAIETFEEGLLIIAGDNSKRAAFLVDELVGQQQVVIKSLGSMFSGIRGITGGAVLADGQVGLIVEAASLVPEHAGEIAADAVAVGG